MNLIDITQFDRIVLDPTPDDQTGGRDAACAGVEGELRSRGPRPGATDVALRSYGDGYVAVGIAGPVDRDTARRFGALLRGLRPFSTRELLVTLALLGPWDPQLARGIGQAREDPRWTLDALRSGSRDVPLRRSSAPASAPAGLTLVALEGLPTRAPELRKLTRPVSSISREMR